VRRQSSQRTGNDTKSGQKDYVSKDQYETFRANAEATAALVKADKANVVITSCSLNIAPLNPD